MKKISVFAVLSALLINIISPFSNALAATVVRIPDPNLKKAINQQLSDDEIKLIMKLMNENPGMLYSIPDFRDPLMDITDEEMSKLTTLTYNNKSQPYDSSLSIKDLNGLDYAKNLTNLNLRYNEIQDVTIINTLTSLISLDLSNN